MLLRPIQGLGMISFISKMNFTFLQRTRPFLTRTRGTRQEVMDGNIGATSNNMGRRNEKTMCRMAYHGLFIAELRRVFFHCQHTGEHGTTMSKRGNASESIGVSIKQTVRKIRRRRMFYIFATFGSSGLVFFFENGTHGSVTYFRYNFRFFVDRRIRFLLGLTLRILDATNARSVGRSYFISVTVSGLNTRFCYQRRDDRLANDVEGLILLFSGGFAWHFRGAFPTVFVRWDSHGGLGGWSRYYTRIGHTDGLQVVLGYISRLPSVYMG